MPPRKIHLHESLLHAWEEGRLTGDELLERVLPHLGEDCPTCRGVIRGWKRRRRGPELLAPSALAELRRGLKTARKTAPPTTTREAEAELDELMKLDPAQRLARVDRSYRRHRSHLLVLVAHDRVRRIRSHDPDSALDLLDLVHSLVMMLDGSDVTSRAWRASLAVTTYTLRSNLHRVRADLAQAESWIRVARSLALAIEPPDPFVMAELDLHDGALRIARRQLVEAVHLLASAACRFARSGVALEQAQSLILLADAFRLQQEYRSALDALAGAGLVLRPEDDLLTYVSCHMQRVLILCDVGDFRAARVLLAEHRPRLRELMDRPLVPLRLRWLEGRIALGEGRHEEARVALEESRTMAVERNYSYDAALISLRLAELYLDLGDLDALRSEAKGIIPVLTSEGLHDEAAAALSLYRDALLGGMVERSFLDRLTKYLEAACRDPRLRFRG